MSFVDTDRTESRSDRSTLDSVESPGRQPVEIAAPPCPRIGPAAGALIAEVAARLAELSRAIRDLERLVLPAGVQPEAAARSDGPARETAGHAGAEAPDEAQFSLFVEVSNLTRREADVLRHLLHGHSNRRISRSLRISESTVKNHLHAIFVKLDSSDRTQVVAKVYRFMADRTPPRDPAPDPRES